MGVFQSVGGAATSGQGFTGAQVAEALRASAESQRRRHQERVDATAGGQTGSHHRRTRTYVVQTLEDIEESSFNAHEVIKTTLPGCADDICITEYAPEVFRYLRQLEGVTETQFGDEWTLPPEKLGMELGEGRSMAMFMKSKSMSFMCKTISDVEVGVLLGILKPYTDHLSRNHHSLLMRFLMLLKVEVGTNVAYLLCFADIFSGCEMLNERWDIKGRKPKPGKYRHFEKWAVEQQDSVAKIDKGDKTSTTNNNERDEDASAVSNHRSTPSVSLPHVDHEKLITQKDKDLTRLFWLSAEDRDELMHQLEQDFGFLKLCGLMDYSILIGVTYTKEDPAARHMRQTFALGEEHRRSAKEIRAVSREPSPEVPQLQRGSSGITAGPFIRHNSKYHYGVPSVEGYEVYYIGIIDMLTVFNMKKRTANCCKQFLWTSETLSTIPPVPYRDRIWKYAKKIFTSPASDDRSPSQ